MSDACAGARNMCSHRKPRRCSASCLYGSSSAHGNHASIRRRRPLGTRGIRKASAVNFSLGDPTSTRYSHRLGLKLGSPAGYLSAGSPSRPPHWKAISGALKRRCPNTTPPDLKRLGAHARLPYAQRGRQRVAGLSETRRHGARDHSDCLPTWAARRLARRAALRLGRPALAPIQSWRDDPPDRTCAGPARLDDLVRKYGERVRAVLLDVTDESAAQAAVQTAVATFGRLDVVVNNAGYGDIAPFEQLSAERFKAVMVTNFYGMVNVTHAAVPLMREQRSGCILQISSVGGHLTRPGSTPYHAAK